MLTFVSSRAPAYLTKVTRNLAAIQRLFGKRIGQDMFLYSIARDPERDSRAMLKNWAVWSGAGPGGRSSRAPGGDPPWRSGVFRRSAAR